jgi:ankyrin repeat protein
LSYQNNQFKNLRNHPEMEAAHDDLGWTVAHDHIRNGEVALLSHQLRNDVRLIQLRDSWGATALHWAAAFGNMEAISALLEAGADVNAVCKRGGSVLFWSLRSHSITCCRAIINAGADLHHIDYRGENVLMHYVTVKDCTEDIVELFLSSGMDLEVQNSNGSTALMLASTFGSSKICSMLSDAGASIDSTDHLGRNALWDAIIGNRHTNIQLLIAHGTSLRLLDKYGDSIIVCATLLADIDTMKILEEARIEGLPMDPDSVDDYWYWFDRRDKSFLGQRASLEDEEAAFEALLNSIVPSSNPPPPPLVKSFDIPGAYPVEPIDELDSSATSEVGDSAEVDDTDEPSSCGVLSIEAGSTSILS